MIFAVDVGNTNITIGCLEGDEISYVFRISTNAARTADEYAIQVNNMLAFNGIERTKISGAVISCVVPPLTRVFREAVNLLFNVEAIVVGAGVKTGLNIMIDDPGQLAGDMVATAVGALAAYPLPILVVDMGTATKMFVLDRNGSFIGGAILPGVALSMYALATGTAQLPRVPIEAPTRSISSNTIDCIKSGVIFGAAAEIDGMTQRFEEELGEPVHVVATGGLASAVYQHCRRDVVHDPNLILRGLGMIYERNKRK